jgi:hypothetical protein
MREKEKEPRVVGPIARSTYSPTPLRSTEIDTLCCIGNKVAFSLPVHRPSASAAFFFVTLSSRPHNEKTSSVAREKEREQRVITKTVYRDNEQQFQQLKWKARR